MNVCARRAQKPSLLGLCRAAAKRLLRTNFILQDTNKGYCGGLKCSANEGSRVCPYCQLH